MQYNSPFCGTGFPNYKQFHPCNFSFPPHIIHPEVIGEGDVASVIYPDGSLHFYFIPTGRRNSSYCEHEIPAYYPLWNHGGGAFYVKSISNPITAAVFSQQYQKLHRTPFPGTCLFSDCNVNTPTPFQLKFHNDSWTSTTDLQYFYPRSRRCEWQPISSPMECVAIQANIPTTESPNRCQIVCDKPCLCPRDSNAINTSSKDDIADECSCAKVYNSRSRSSMSSSRGTSKTELKKNKLSLKKHNRRKLLNKKSNVQCKCHEPSKLSNKNSNVQCKSCHEPIKIDKSVTTYADQGNDCCEAERDTQTSFIQELERIMPASNSSKKTELLCPSSSKCNRPVEEKPSEKIINIFDTDASSVSCCCSATDTDDTIKN